VLLAWSAAFVMLAFGVVYLRWRYRRRLDEIARARALLRQALRSLKPPRETGDPR
jgi:hypothetical protein